MKGEKWGRSSYFVPWHHPAWPPIALAKPRAFPRLPGQKAAVCVTKPVHLGQNNIAQFSSDPCTIMQHTVYFELAVHVLLSWSQADVSSGVTVCVLPDAVSHVLPWQFLGRNYGKPVHIFVYWIMWVMAALPWGTRLCISLAQLALMYCHMLKTKDY